LIGTRVAPNLDQWKGKVASSPDEVLLVTQGLGEPAGDTTQDPLGGKRAIDATVGALCRVITREETVTVVKHFSDPFDQTKISAIRMPSNDDVARPGWRSPIRSGIDQYLVTRLEKGGH